MGRVTYTPLGEGTSSASAANAILTAIEAQSTKLAALNFEDEGLDARSLESEIQASQPFTPHTLSGAPGTQILSTTWATLNPSHAGAQFRTGTMSVAANERLRVVFDVDFVSDATQEGIPSGGDVQIRFRYSVGGTPAVIGSTRRVLATAPVAVTPFAGAPARVRHQVVVDGAAGLDWVEVQISDQSGTGVTVQIGDATMFGTIYKRVTV